MHVNPILNTFNPISSFRFKQMSRPSYSKPIYSVPRVPTGLTADAISDAIAVAYGTAVHVRLVPANPIFRYGGVQHAAIITMAQEENTNRNDCNPDFNPDFNHDFNHDFKVVYDFNHDFNHDFKVVYDLEAQLHFTMHKMNTITKMNKMMDKQRLWRWALRGIVIQ